MSTDNNTGIQTRAMAQRIENEGNPEQLQGTPNPAMNPTVELHKTKEEAIKEFVRQHGTIALDWYVPDFCNTRVGDLIKERLPLETTEGRILFSCPPLSEFFKTSNFELDLRTGRVYTYLDPPEDIGVSCQQEQFDPGVPYRHTTRWTWYQYNTRRETRENSKGKENSRTSRCHGPRGSRVQNMPVLPSMDTVCRKFSRTWQWFWTCLKTTTTTWQ